MRIRRLRGKFARPRSSRSRACKGA
jgi:hypothetical protein